MAHVDVTSTIPDGDLLAVLITAEGLLFAALAVGVTLQTLAPGTFLPAFVKKGWLAFSIFLVTLLVATGAGATWWQIYAHDFPQPWFASLAGPVALGAAIVAQPILAFGIWLGMRST